MEKIEFRRFYKNLRRDLDYKELENISEKITALLLDSNLYKESKEIFVYVSIKKEISTINIIKNALNDQKEVYVPFIDKDMIKCARVYDLDDLKIGSFNIPTSFSNEFIKNPDLSLVPGLAFDKDKNRLGMGGGFYDRFLMENETKALGLFAQIFEAVKLPTNHMDKKLDYIITENGIF